MPETGVSLISFDLATLPPVFLREGFPIIEIFLSVALLIVLAVWLIGKCQRRKRSISPLPISSLKPEISSY